jgi:putative Ca2+/H+ antiporter (TMEM165/GDT1 family)
MLVDLKLLLSTFGLLFLAELGDKTQLAVFTLVARHKEPIPIFLGAALALVLVTALAAVVGQGVAQVVPDVVLRRGAAGLFVVMGLLIWFRVL